MKIGMGLTILFRVRVIIGPEAALLRVLFKVR